MTVTFDKDHDNPKDSQLIIVITGTPEGIEQAVKDMQMGNNSWSRNYKPVQGTVINFNSTRSVITPVWKGEKY